MRLPAVLATLSFTLLAEAQNFSSYVPECAPPCVEQTLNSTKVCTGLDDNECLCRNFQQIVLSARICFVQTCNNTDIGALRSEITSGWQKFCNDSGTPLDLSSGWSPGGPGGPGGPESPAPSSSATTPLPSTSSSTSSTTSSLAAPSDTGSASSSDLSTGAKAGIGVGVGIGSLAVIIGLVFLGFRLGKRKGARNEAEGTSPSNERGHLEDGRDIATTAGGGGEHWAYKEQPEGVALAELPSPHVELPADDVRELPTQEHPVELWHDPPELSADSEIPRDRTRRL